MSNPKCAVHFNNRGLANYHLRMHDMALEDFNTAIAIDTDDPDPSKNPNKSYQNYD